MVLTRPSAAMGEAEAEADLGELTALLPLRLIDARVRRSCRGADSHPDGRSSSSRGSFSVPTPLLTLEVRYSIISLSNTVSGQHGNSALF